MVNIETHRITDMINSREYDDVVKWLKTYPNIKVVSRDGSITYHNAIKTAHPKAIQVSDRFHLLKNLTSYAKDYLKKELKQHITIKAPAIDDDKKEIKSKKTPRKADENRKLTTEEKYQKILIMLNEGKNKSYICKEVNMDMRTYNRLMNMSDFERNKLFKTKLMAKHEEKVMMKIEIITEIREMKNTGISNREIERRTGISRVTIRKYLDENYNPIHASYGNKKNGKLTPYLKEINSCLEIGVMGSVIEKEIRKKGYAGSSSTIRQYIADWKRRRKQDYHSCNGDAVRMDVIERKDVMKLLYHPLEKIKSIKKEQFVKICEDYPCFQMIHETVWRFRELLKAKNLENLNKWIDMAVSLKVSEINSFINGLKRDIEAVRNAVTLNYSNGLAEGSVNKLKVIKRIMYGRCGFETLRTKTLRLEKMRKIN